MKAQMHRFQKVDRALTGFDMQFHRHLWDKIEWRLVLICNFTTHANHKLKSNG